VEIDFTFHAVAGTIVGEPGDIDFSDTTDSELERIALPHAVNMFTLKSFTRRLRFGFDLDEKSVFPENAMNCSPGTREIELVLDPSGSTGGIFPVEPDNPLFQGCWYCPTRPFPGPGLLWFQTVLGVVSMVLRLLSHSPFGDVVRLSDLFGTSFSFFVEYYCFGPDLHCRFHLPAPGWCS
jgi:hypothetical protein